MAEALDLGRDTIFLTLAGSQAHGTAHEGSDVDVRGVCVAPLAVRLSLHRSFEQHEGPLPEALRVEVAARLAAHPTASRGLSVKLECAIHDVAKLLRLLAAANPTALEVLFTDERDWLLDTPAWRRLHGARHRFLTRKVQQTFLGYAQAQLRKIRTHRAWLLSPPARQPTREDFGLPPAGTLSRDEVGRLELAIAEKLRSYGVETLELPKATRIAVEERLRALHLDVLQVPEPDLEDRVRAVAVAALALPREVVSALEAERRYRSAQRHWESYQAWKVERNPARAELERAHGYDTKHAMHLVRLMRMGLEVLQEGELRVRRPDAAELAAIREGALTFEALEAQARDLEARMREAASRTTLPLELDLEWVDALALELMTTPR